MSTKKANKRLHDSVFPLIFKKKFGEGGEGGGREGVRRRRALMHVHTCSCLCGRHSKRHSKSETEKKEEKKRKMREKKNARKKK